MVSRILPRIALLSAISALLIVAIATFIPNSTAFAAECGGVQTSIISGDICNTSNVNSNDSSQNPVVAVIKFVLQLLTGAVGLVAVGMIVYAGILYSSAGGNQGQVAKAKEYLINTVLGVVIYLGMILILNWLIPGGIFGQQAIIGSGTQNPPASSGNNGNPGSATGPSTSLTFASWNTYTDNPREKSAIVRSLMSSSSIDVLGLQEIHKAAHRTDIRNDVPNSTYGLYMTSGSGRTASYPIVYNKTKLQVVSHGSRRLGSTGDLTDRYAVYVRFRIRSTKQEFFFINTHLPPTVEAGGRVSGNSTYIAAYKRQMPNLTSLIRSLRSNNIPIFIVGDFNVNQRRDNCSVSWFPCSAMKAVNVRSAFAITNRSSIPSSCGTHGDGTRLIDYVFVLERTGVKVNSSSVVGCGGNGWRGSDHRPSVARVTISTAASN